MKPIFAILTLSLAMAFAGCPASGNKSGGTGDAGGSPGATGKSENDGSLDDRPKVNSNSKTIPAKIPDKSKTDMIESIYTDLAADKCKTVELNEDEAWSVQLCKGVAGYKLEVAEGDIRQTINVIYPNGKKHELKLWNVVSPAFSSVGKKAEWRVKKKNGKIMPIALIVRYNASENAKNPEETTSYLTVTKITKDKACVTDVVNPIKNANVKARKLADVSADKPCKKRK